MIRKIFFFFFISLASFAQNLSSDAEVSLLTIAPGQELYSTFGHSAIRVSDPVNSIDINFNYGTFDFSTHGFYLKFLRGILPYKISAHPYGLEMDYWSRNEGRAVIAQVLNLSANQKQKVWDYLQINMQPENQEYAYKFFYDNCSTRLLDVLKKACGDSLIFDTKLHIDSTYRNWISKYSQANNQAWADFGMDLVIGIPSDQKTGWRGATFIPNNLSNAFEKAKIKQQNGSVLSFVKTEYQANIVFKNETIKEFSPVWAMYLLLGFVLGFTIWQIIIKSKSIFFDKIWSLIYGLAGVLIFMLWFFTSHGVTEQNLNIIWLFPLLPLFIFTYKKHKISRIFLFILLIISILILIFNPFMPQKLHPASIPLVLLSFVRLTYLLYSGKKYGFK